MKKEIVIVVLGAALLIAAVFMYRTEDSVEQEFIQETGDAMYPTTGGYTEEEKIGETDGEATVGTVTDDPYTLDDVVDVSFENFDPYPAAIDDEYTIYTLTLSDGTIRKIELAGMLDRDTVSSRIEATGYVGGEQELLDLIHSL